MATDTLENMLDELRAEIGVSLAPGHNLNQQETQLYTLRRTQRELYLTYDWPTLVTEERYSVTAGDRYAGPFTDVDYEQINEVYSSYGSDWVTLDYQFKPEDYTVYDNESGDQGYPIRRYRPVVGEEKIELWPIPNQDTTLIIRGQKKLGSLTELSDTSTLDSTLIVLFAAADLLQEWDQERAARKASKAAAYLRSLRMNLSSHRQRVTRMTPDHTPKLRPYLDYIPEM